MGQPAQSIALLLMEHVRAPFTGPVLSYGKQAMNIGYGGMLKMFASLGIPPHPAGMVDPPPPDKYVDFARLFSLLGLGELQTLDVSGYEGAEIIADLNLPVPRELVGRFGLIVDGGTMEHVFDIRQGMQNTADMVRAGGRVVHLSPMNNYVNHGFVQLSPALYHDYYVENGFDDVRGIVIVQPRAEILSTDWNFVHYDRVVMSGETRCSVRLKPNWRFISAPGKLPSRPRAAFQSSPADGGCRGTSSSFHTGRVHHRSSRSRTTITAAARRSTTSFTPGSVTAASRRLY